MDKQKILKALSDALDELYAEPEHLVAEFDFRSVSNERIEAQLDLKNGEMVAFHFHDTPHVIQKAADKARLSGMHEEPDWSQVAANSESTLPQNRAFYDGLAVTLDIKK